MITILHGWSTDQFNHQKWDALRGELQKRGIETEILGIPGLSAPLDEVWNLQNYMEWLDSELKGRKNVILLGHSFGGQMAVRYAALHPDKVQKLILVDSAGMRDHHFLPTVKRNVFWLMAKIGKIFSGNEMLRGLLYKLAREKDYHNAPPLLRRTMSTILDDEVVNDLPKIQSPTLIIWGSEDKVTPLFMSQIFHQKIAKSVLKIVNGARHSPQFTHVAEVAKYIEEFLD